MSHNQPVRPRATATDSEPTPLPSVPQAPTQRRRQSNDHYVNHFFDNFKIWRIFHDDRGVTTFTKQKLVAAFFTAEAAEDRDLDERIARSTGSAEKALREQRRKRRDSRQHFVTRAVERLQSIGVPIDDVDADGWPVQTSTDTPRQRRPKNDLRCWRYNPHALVARDLGDLLDTYGISGYELVGILACKDLLARFQALPTVAGISTIAERMLRLVPPALAASIQEQARCWQYSLGDTAKYNDATRRQVLSGWYASVLQQKQVELLYAKPCAPSQWRRVAPLGMRFDAEENAIYLIGSSPSSDTSTCWGHPKQYKLDRTHGLRRTLDPNPDAEALTLQDRIEPAAGSSSPMQLDMHALYADSVGPYFRFGHSPIRLEAIVHKPCWIAWCIEKPFHPKQRTYLETSATGESQLRIVVDRCDIEEITSRLLRIGDAFTVISPTHLITRIRVVAEQLLQRHMVPESLGFEDRL